MIWFVLGLVALVAGAELLVRGASRLALSLGISPLVVGLTVVSLGTSAPEMAVSVQSAWVGQVDIALGNVVGSNIANILLILGVSALIVPLTVHQQIIRQEVPVMIGLSLLLWALALDGGISRHEGLGFLVVLTVYIVILIRKSRREQAAVRAEYDEAMTPSASGWDSTVPVQIILILAGLALLVQGSNWLVEAAVGFAKYLGVSELVIGLTVVAVGTSLPEVATSILAAIRGERDIAVGNAVGSNIFNILAVLGVTAAIAPDDLNVAPALLALDIPIMVAVALICLPIFFTGSQIGRFDGALFLGYYIAYTTYLVLHASAHGALAGYTSVMGNFVLPATVLTVLILAWRHWRRNGLGTHGRPPQS